MSNASTFQPALVEGGVTIRRKPHVYLVGKQIIEQAEVDRFLSDHGVEQWSTDTRRGRRKADRDRRADVLHVVCQAATRRQQRVPEETSSRSATAACWNTRSSTSS